MSQSSTNPFSAMPTLPNVLYLSFIATTLLGGWLFYRAANSSGRVLGVLGLWLLVQSLLALSGFYTVAASRPPRLLLALLPPLLVIAALFNTEAGRRFLDGLRLDRLTLVHLLRVPVELVLFWLFLHKAVPQLMTFEGRNYDVLSGLSAPVVYYLAFRGRQMGWRGLLAWNIGCLLLLLNIVVNAVLSAPTVVQQFAFDQPNVAILYFPFIALPSCLVPLVALAHLAAIRRLVRERAAAVLPLPG
ncbi:hypothetical protein [Hymenobacter bucti]